MKKDDSEWRELRAMRRWYREVHKPVSILTSILNTIITWLVMGAGYLILAYLIPFIYSNFIKPVGADAKFGATVTILLTILSFIFGRWSKKT